MPRPAHDQHRDGVLAGSPHDLDLALLDQRSEGAQIGGGARPHLVLPLAMAVSTDSRTS